MEDNNVSVGGARQRSRKVEHNMKQVWFLGPGMPNVCKVYLEQEVRVVWSL